MLFTLGLNCVSAWPPSPLEQCQWLSLWSPSIDLRSTIAISHRHHIVIILKINVDDSFQFRTVEHLKSLIAAVHVITAVNRVKSRPVSIQNGKTTLCSCVCLSVCTSPICIGDSPLQYRAVCVGVWGCPSNCYSIVKLYLHCHLILAHG